MSSVSRREAIAAMGAVAVSGTLSPSALSAATPAAASTSRNLLSAGVELARLVKAGRLNQSVARWCFARTPLAELCAAGRDMGLRGVDLLDQADWLVPREHGLRCAIGNSFGSISKGFNRLDHHDELVAAAAPMIPAAAAAGVERLVVFSGNRAGLSDGDGIANCILGLKRLMPLAEQHGVTLCMEMLNSKVDHRDYHADHTAWAAEVVAGVGSERFRLLYDVYHMQVMEGDVIATITRYHDIIAHYHTAGVPGRHEIGDEQELNYRRIAEVIADTGFAGYVAHEFLPQQEPLGALRDAVVRCTV